MDTREKGTQTDEVGNEAMLASASSITRYGCPESLAMADGEAFLHVKPCIGAEHVHDRLQELEQLLGIKSTEAAQLKLRVQLLEESDTASLRDELKDANREIQKWRERAEAAERKARMFQRFTTRIRSIHSSLAMAEGSRQSGDDEVVSLEGRDAEGSYRVHRVRFTKAGEAMEREGDVDGSTEDEGGAVDGESVVVEKMEGFLHRNKGREGSSLGGHGVGMDGVASPREEGAGMLDFGSAAVALWIAAQEFLLMEDDEASHHSSGVSNGGSFSEFSELGNEEDQHI